MADAPVIPVTAYLTTAKPAEPAAPVVTVVEKARPALGPLGLTLLGVVAAYVLPKLIDHFAPGLFETDGADEYELELEP